LSAIVTAAVRAPVAVGLKVTLIEQLALSATVAGDNGHVVVCEKSPALVPVSVMLEIVNAPGPLLVSVVLCAALVVFVV
jgi:hypothetical protein